MSIELITEKVQPFLQQVANSSTAVWLGRIVTPLKTYALPIALAAFILLGLAFCYRKYYTNEQPPAFKNTFLFELTSNIFKKDAGAIEKCILENYETLPVYEYDFSQKLPKPEELLHSVFLLKTKQSHILAFKVESDKQQKVVLFEQNPFTASNEWYQLVQLLENRDEVPYFNKRENQNDILDLLNKQSLYAFKLGRVTGKFNINFDCTWRLAQKENDNPSNEELKKNLANKVPQKHPTVTFEQFNVQYDNTFPVPLVNALLNLKELPIHPQLLLNNGLPQYEDLEKPVMIVKRQLDQQKETVILACKIESQDKIEKKVAFVQKTALSWSSPDYLENQNYQFQGLCTLITTGTVKDTNNVQWTLVS